ncbi:hypothetical protein BaRGS_00003351 [Batillaria attramentaria]|uniref:Uncharacterized protein n=1 Tax=Batillaria attramentaria TaxID=370345 RepID=A0ABD0M2T9_9CAEN
MRGSPNATQLPVIFGNGIKRGTDEGIHTAFSGAPRATMGPPLEVDVTCIYPALSGHLEVCHWMEESAARGMKTGDVLCETTAERGLGSR